eukprot:g6740.t1
MFNNRRNKFKSSHIEGLVRLKEQRSPVSFYTPISPPPFKYPPLPEFNDNINSGKSSKDSARETDVSLNTTHIKRSSSPSIRIPTPVHLTSSVQASNAIEILNKQRKRIYNTKLKQLLGYICETLENAMYYKAAPVLITYKDIIKGIELSLSNHVGKVKKACLMLEKENDTLRAKINNDKMDTLTVALQFEQTNKHIRELKASIKRAKIRTKKAVEERNSMYEVAMEKEEMAHASKSRAEAFEQNSFALHDQIYESQNLRKQLELDQSRMFTLENYRETQQVLENTKKQLENTKTKHKEEFEEFEAFAKQIAAIESSIIKCYEDQENSTVGLYETREVQTPRPQLEHTVLRAVKKQFIHLADDLRNYTTQVGNIVNEELSSSGLLSGIFRKLYLVLQKNSSHTHSLRTAMDYSLLLGNQPRTSDFVNMMASLVSYRKTLTVAKEALLLREEYYQSVQSYEEEKVVLDQVTDKVMGDEKRAKKYGLHTFKITELHLKDGTIKKYAKIMGHEELPAYLQIVDVEARAKNVFVSDKNFLKQIERHEQEHQVYETNMMEKKNKVDKQNDIIVKRRRKSDILSDKKSDISRVIEIIPIEDIKNLLKLIEDIYNFQRVLLNIENDGKEHENSQNLFDLQLVVERYFRNNRFFPQIGSFQKTELEKRLLEESPWSVVDVDKLFEVRYPTEANSPPPPQQKHKASPKKKKKHGKQKKPKTSIVTNTPNMDEKPKDSFMHFLIMMYLESNRKYYLTFRDKLNIANPAKSEKVAVPLLSVALTSADPYAKKSLINQRLADILGVQDVADLADNMFNPPGESPTKFINIKLLVKRLLCGSHFFPKRFYNLRYDQAKPCIVFDTSTCYSKKPLSEDETIIRILSWSTVYNDGKRTKVITTKENSNDVNILTARRIVGYEGVETRTPRRKRKNKHWNKLQSKSESSSKHKSLYHAVEVGMIKWLRVNNFRKKKTKL